MNASLVPEDGGLSLSCAELEVRVVQRFLEMDSAAVSAGLAVLKAASGPAATPGARRELLFLLGQPRPSVEAWERAFRCVSAAQDRDVAAAICVAAVDAALGGGRSLAVLAPWRSRMEGLLARGEGLGLRERVALGLRQGLLALLCDGDAGAALSLIRTVAGLQPALRSTSLALSIAALSGVRDCLAGHRARAEVHLADAGCLCHQREVSALSRLMVGCALAFTRVCLGDSARALAVLDLVGGEGGLGGLPEPACVLSDCVRLYVAALLGQQDVFGRLGVHIGRRSVPGRRYLLECFRHLALGVGELAQGKALWALIHAEEGLANGEQACARLPRLLCALLQLQALSDLGRADDARACYARWMPEWRRLDLRTLAATANLEQAALNARLGEFDRARVYRQRAAEVLPAGEGLIALNRGAAWHARLEAWQEAANGEAGTSPYVVIHTFGELLVEIKGRRIYDRDWKGQRTRMLLIALICEGGQKVPTARLADMLWPEAEGDRAMQNLKVALHRLRRLGCGAGETPVNWVHVKHGMVSLARGLCEVDVHRLLAGQACGGAGPVLPDAWNFLPGLSEPPCVEAYRRLLQLRLRRGSQGVRPSSTLDPGR